MSIEPAALHKSTCAVTRSRRMSSSRAAARDQTHREVVRLLGFSITHGVVGLTPGIAGALLERPRTSVRYADNSANVVDVRPAC